MLSIWYTKVIVKQWLQAFYMCLTNRVSAVSLFRQTKRDILGLIIESA